MIDAVLYQLRRPFNQSIAGYAFYMRLLGRRRIIERNVADLKAGRTAFFVTGFPRSGNTVLTYLLKQFPEMPAFSHHLHNQLALKLALRQGMKLYVLLRSPAESIPSLVLMNANSRKSFLRFGSVQRLMKRHHLVARLYLREYIDYYRFVASNRARLTIISSEMVFEASRHVVGKIACDHGLPVERIDSGWCADHIHQYFSRKKTQAGDNQLSAAVPTELKQAAKEELMKSVGTERLFDQAMQVYEDLRQAAWHPESG